MKGMSWFVLFALSLFLPWQKQSPCTCQAFNLRSLLCHRQRLSEKRQSTTTLDMGKGFQSAKNKQAALAQKMQQAKQQQHPSGSDQDNASGGTDKQDKETATNKTDKKLKNDNDDMRAEFRKLLATNLPPSESSNKSNDVATIARPLQRPKASDTVPPVGPKVKARDLKRKRKRQQLDQSAQKQEKPEPNNTVVLNVGDKARRRDFETLVQPTTRQPLGPLVAAQLVPWVPPYLTEYLIVVADPRRQSNDLRAVLQYIIMLGDETFSANFDSSRIKILAVTADEPQELVSWQKRSDLDQEQHNVNVGLVTMVLDPALEWMHTYACMDQGGNPWSTHLLIMDTDGVIRHHVDQVHPSLATGMLTKMLQEMEQS